MAKPAGSLYRGGGGMWAWVAHRITGVLMVFFVVDVVLDTALVRVSPDAYDRVMDTYKNPVVVVLQVGLVGAVLYHALNGIRLTLVDFWADGVRYQKTLLWAVVALWVVVMVPVSYLMLLRTASALFGSA